MGDYRSKSQRYLDTEKKFKNKVGHTLKTQGTLVPYPLILYEHRCNLTECFTDENSRKPIFKRLNGSRKDLYQQWKSI